jgi:hypothetical protein
VPLTAAAMSLIKFRLKIVFRNICADKGSSMGASGWILFAKFTRVVPLLKLDALICN